MEKSIIQFLCVSVFVFAMVGGICIQWIVAMAVHKKKTLKKNSAQKKKQPFRMRAIYVVIPSLVIGLFLSVNLLASQPQKTAVLGASVQQTNQNPFLAFDNFFASFVSLFTGKSHTTTVTSDSVRNETSSLISPNTSQTSTTQISSTTQTTFSQTQLDAMAGNTYANGVLPLGDNKYMTSGPKKGYVYLCHVMKGNGGAQSAGTWMGTATWTTHGKPVVSGKVSWPNAAFSDTVSGSTRILSGNGLPMDMATGIYPVQSTDIAYQYDRNPNSIKSQSLHLTLPIDPTYSDTPNCMGGEVGVMTNGVPLFNAFDEEMRDAPAHEIQDACDGHPQSSGEYHYHSLSSCFTNISVQTVIGFALDGFPITGPVASNGKYLTTTNLDECHGITSQINLDGKLVTMYHYVMTQDFPYSVSCFRGKPVSLQVISMGGQKGTDQMQNGSSNQTGVQTNLQSSHHPQPPQTAFSICSGKATGTSCSFTSPRGTVSGSCQTPPGQTSLVCVPSN